MRVCKYIFSTIYFFFFLGAEEEAEVDAAAAAVVIEDAEAAEAEVEVAAAEAEVEVAAAVIETIKMLLVILARTWIISNLNTPDMDIENAIRITETREGIREAAVAAAVEVEEVAEVEIIAEIPAQTIVRITVKITIRITIKVTGRITIISSRSIPAREIRMEVTIGAAGTTIRTGEKVAEGEAEFKEDGIKVPTIPVRTAISAAATTGAEADNTEDATSHMFLSLAKVSHEERKL